MPGPALPLYLIHWNAPEWCASAARSVLGSRGVAVDVAVVDNGQAGGPPLEDVLPAGVRVLPMPRNLGFAGGANAAFRDWTETRPDADLGVIGSHDLHVEPDALRRLVDAARSDPRLGVLGPVFDSPKPTAGGMWNGWSGSRVPFAEADGIIDRDWLPGACLLLRRDVLDDVGGFDERFESYTEDKDLCLRAKDAGWKVAVVAGAKARGLGQVSPDRATPLGVANGVFLVTKRRGLLAGGAKLGRVLLSVGYDGLALLWGANRNRTRKRLRANLAGVGRVLRSSGVLLDMARERRTTAPRGG